jgi:DNA polymerase-3 subunit alpha
MQTEQDVRKGLAYLGKDVVDEAVKNTLDLVERTSARIGGKPTAPVYSKQGGADRDVERLLDLCVANWGKIADKPDQDGYMARFEREFALLRKKGFCGYFLMVSDYCRYAKANGILVGPGRGSDAGSLVAYLSDITEVDPIEAKLPFERFMTEGRVSLPDFDVDFPASKKEVMLQYLADKYGADHIIQIGTHLKLKSKGIVKDLGRALMSVLVHLLIEDKIGNGYIDGENPEAETAARAEIYKDLTAVSKIIKGAEAGTAGLGMPWDELWAQFGDELDPYRQKYPDLFTMADKLVGRLKSYGKHAAGVVISTDRSLHDWLPLMTGEGGRMVSQFDMVALEQMGLVKFDILTIRTLDTIQMAFDLIKENRRVDVDVYAWREEYADPPVWDEIAAGNTLGMFQIETKAGTRLSLRMKPSNMQELADMNTIVRPGPMRSGLTETYLRRRSGEEVITYADPRMEEILGDAQGAPIYQDHVLQLLMTLAGYSSDEADEVRKILGKKKVEKIAGAGQEFVARAREWGGMDREVAQHLWDQLAEFAKYGFNKAHAYSYSMISYWTAWLKIHYPIEFFVAALSTIEKDRIPEFIKEVRRHGYTVLPPDINASGKGFKAEPLAVRYGLDAIKGIGEAAVDYLIEGQLYTTFEEFDRYVTAKGSKAGAGVQMLLVKIGALDSLEPRRAALIKKLADRKSGVDALCVHRDGNVLIPVDKRKAARDAGVMVPPDFCGFDWDAEPAPTNPRTGKKLKKKLPPMKCTKACRQYLPPKEVDLSDEKLSDEDLRAIEYELLGVFLSSTPFDRLNPLDRKQLFIDAERLLAGAPGIYTVAAILMGVRKTKTRASQEDMAFLTLDTEVSTLEAVAFPRTWSEISPHVASGQLCLVSLEQQDGDRGLVVREYLPVL